ncbi:hypothetical protein Zmor_011791 [Zophobas morio]|uniref:dynamin GTPase n=1 Tax=Zophobas morio TaxID=2755281 RepID=A0AA38M0C0_9CUCU|nr:hypothetical protein Zmor_011791 [Zophobas morio]
MNNRGLQDLIPVVNKLHDVFSRLGRPCPINLPQIAVVGGQSAGKSSVLESFVGKDFLPRGAGICTRRPLILQMYYQSGEEYGKFLHTKEKKYYNFEDIRKEIEAETDRVTGKNKNISPLPINLSIYSPNVLNLTLIDLPGLTKVAIGGQPRDIEKQINDMIMDFITKENCLILAVSPANIDLANSDALKMAKLVDPQGLRTIGVLTKLDLMDQGTDAREILTNQFLPLRRGYVGVVNRSQKEIDGKKGIQAALEAEMAFFRAHPAYRDLNNVGTKRLQCVLNQQLTNHIRDSLPDLKKALEDEIEKLEEECEQYKGLMFSASELRSIHYLFFKAQREYDEHQLRKEIATAVLNVKGVHSGVFTPDQAFTVSLQRQISHFLDPCIKCADEVLDELIEAFHSTSEAFLHYPVFRDALEDAVLSLLRAEHEKAVEQIKIFFSNETAYINTNHPDFIGFKEATQVAETTDPYDNSADLKCTSANVILRRVNALSRLFLVPGVNRKLLCNFQGFLTLSSGLIKNQFWFVLTSNHVSWYKKEAVAYINSHSHRKNEIELFKRDGEQRTSDRSSLILSCKAASDLDGWKAAFLRAGVLPCKSDDSNDDLRLKELSPLMEKQVEVIRNLVDSYANIVTNSVKDQIPKIIMYQMVVTLKDRFEALLDKLLEGNSAKVLLQESTEKKEQREKEFASLQLAREAMAIISEIKINTKYESVPPPIPDENDILSRLVQGTLLLLSNTPFCFLP